MLAHLRLAFCKLIVRTMTDSIIQALTDTYTKQQSSLTALVEALKTRQSSIDALTQAHADTQARLAALQKQMDQDTQIADLTSKVGSAAQGLAQVVAQAQSVAKAVPSLPSSLKP